MKHVLLIMIFSFFSTLAVSQPEIKGSPNELRGFLYPADKIVILHGQAEEKAYSDKAIVSLVVTTENKLLSTAISENGALRAVLIKGLMDAGISSEAIKNSKFSSSPQFGWFGSKPSSFEVINRMAISIQDEKHLVVIAAVADNHEEVSLSNTNFEHTKKDEYSKKVKAKALKKILQQKAYYEESLGVTLTPIGIRDSNIVRRATRGAVALEEVLVTAARRGGDQKFSSTAKPRGQRQVSSFDEVKYEANLAVEFKIQ